jgi:hypothetical protein
VQLENAPLVHIPMEYLPIGGILYQSENSSENFLGPLGPTVYSQGRRWRGGIIITELKESTYRQHIGANPAPLLCTKFIISTFKKLALHRNCPYIKVAGLLERWLATLFRYKVLITAKVTL